MQNGILIGSGFYSTPETHLEKLRFLSLWIENTLPFCPVIVDNSKSRLKRWVSFESVRIQNNAGHCSLPINQTVGPMLGWSISWIIPAFIAYSEGCDFVYKEQDCLCFGDWLPHIKTHRMAFGRCQQMRIETCLFYIRHDFIIEAIHRFMGFKAHDAIESVESKFERMMANDPENIGFHDLPGGRDRPWPEQLPFCVQKITDEELKLLCPH